MESLFEQLGGTYTRQGDYCLPDVCLPPEEERPIGVYGQRRPMASACFVCRKEQCCFEMTLFRTLLTLFFYSGIMYL